MNKQELKACLIIAGKMGWLDKSPRLVLSTILDMVIMQQCRDLALSNDCDDREETLLSMALWDKEKLFEIKRESRTLTLNT